MTEIEVWAICVVLPVRYDEEDIPNDFPLRKGDVWAATIDIDSGYILEWPDGVGARTIECMKVTDGGKYTLIDNLGREIATREDYVPHGVIPGGYGDYVSLQIDERGVITNWPKPPNLSAFFEEVS